MIPSLEAARAINFHRKEALVVSTSSALRDWNAVSERRDLDVDLTDCMDRAPGVGLGLSLAQPDKQILVLDCDATLRTDLAAFATIGESKISNLVHFVFEDLSNVSTDGLPVDGQNNIDLQAMALGAGYAGTYRFSDVEELFLGLESVLSEGGPILVMVEVGRESDQLPFPERPMAEGWAVVRERLRNSD